MLARLRCPPLKRGDPDVAGLGQADRGERISDCVGDLRRAG